jgi:hypothetical protein
VGFVVNQEDDSMPPNFPFRLGRKKNNVEDEKRISATDDPYHIGSSEHFAWRASAGVDSIRGFDWIRTRGIPFLERAYMAYKNDVLKVGDLTRLPCKVIVRPSIDCGGGIAGATGNGELSYCAGTWDHNQFCYGILAHELCNLFTGECVSAAWPLEWWANHRSPFPTVAANEVIRKVEPEYYERWGDYNDPLVQMFSFFFKKHSSMFPRMLQKMQELRISLSGQSDPYLSHLLYYFMFYGAERNIRRYFVSPPMPPLNFSLFRSLEETFRLGVTEFPLE